MSLAITTFTPADNYQEALDRAAALWGIDSGYWDIWGNWHITEPTVKRNLLAALGVPSTTLEYLNQALEERLWREWSVLVPPVFVVDQSGEPAEIPVRVPAELTNHTIEIEIEWEAGQREVIERRLDTLSVSATAQLRGRQFVEKRLPLAASPLGYHCLRLSVEGVTAEAQWIVTPERAYLPPALENGERRAGLSVSLYGVRSARSWGCGDFSDLARLARWVGRDIRGSFIALNPLHAIHNRQPYNTSPYLPTSIYYRNFIYLDVDRIEDLSASAWARSLRRSPRVVAEIQALNDAEFVEYERVARLKRLFLQFAFRAFLREWRSNSQRAQAFRAYTDAEGDLLEHYAIYCALDEWNHKRNPDVWIWPDWPAEFRDPDSEATRRFARAHWRGVLFYKYVQWQIDLQLAAAQQAALDSGLSIGLFHDLALATDRCGGDFWAHQRFFVSGCRVGAPPDDFSPKGQDWSFPPPASEAHWRDGYRHFRESIRLACRHGGALRIDHVMRLFRLFWIPAGREAAEGTYVRNCHEDLVRILALESVRNKALIVGEDLGTVEPSVREILAQFGILSYRLLYFEKNEHGKPCSPDEYPRQALVSSTTHDLPTLAGFWQCRDIKARRAAGVLPDDDSCTHAIAERSTEKQKLLDTVFRQDLLPDWVPHSATDLPELTGELHNAFTGLLASTPCLLLALNQEDLTKETNQQNLPGTTAEYPNWRRKMRYSIEELETSGEVRGFIEMYRHWLEQTGRAEPGSGE